MTFTFFLTIKSFRFYEVIGKILNDFLRVNFKFFQLKKQKFKNIFQKNVFICLHIYGHFEIIYVNIFKYVDT